MTAPERSLATVLFTDIVGSTERAAQLRDAGWRELRAEHDRQVRRALRHFDGREISTAGDIGARVAAEAGPGEILVSRTVAQESLYKPHQRCSIGSCTWDRGRQTYPPDEASGWKPVQQRM